jgi:hypothetical protein
MTQNEKLSTQNKYVDQVISLYLNLPDTPVKPSANDRVTASGFFEREIPLNIIEAALMLASLRRMSRKQDMPPLQPVRSLAYFLPVIQEITESTMPDGYLQYLRCKIRAVTSK